MNRRTAPLTSNYERDTIFAARVGVYVRLKELLKGKRASSLNRSLLP
jgi:hypothetical protein